MSRETNFITPQTAAPSVIATDAAAPHESDIRLSYKPDGNVVLPIWPSNVGSEP